MVSLGTEFTLPDNTLLSQRFKLILAPPMGEPLCVQTEVTMKTIIHIGQHKTGTTSIQKYLQDNRKILAKTGLYVPSVVAGYNAPSHFILNVYALAENRYSTMKEKIIAEKGKHYLSELETHLKKDIKKIYKDALDSKCDKVLWSNEGLYLLNTVTEYNKLKSLFSEYSMEIEVVCCLRDVKSYRNSYIKQLSKQNMSRSNNPDSYRYVEPNSWLFDYKKKKDLLSEIFDRCIYFSYDPNDNVKAFMETINFNVVDTGRYKFNVTVSTHKKLLQRIKKRLAIFYR